MFKFKIPLRAIASVIGAASKNMDSREYLRHPHISHHEGEKYPYIVATDGHRMYRAEMDAAGVPVMENDLPLPMRLVNYILTAPGGWDREVELTYGGRAGQGTITAKIGDMTFTLDSWPEWTYPDWRRVLPNREKFSPVQRIAMNSVYFADLDKGARNFTGNKKAQPLIFEFTSESHPVSILVETPDGPTWLGTLMPMRA